MYKMLTRKDCEFHCVKYVCTLMVLSFLTGGFIYLSVSMNGYRKEIVDDYFYDLVTLLIFYILVAISHQWSFISKMDKLCAHHDDFSHLSIDASQKYLQAVKKARLSGILTASIVLVTLAFIVLGSLMPLLEFAISELNLVVTVTNIFFSTLFITLPNWQGYILCAQMSCNLTKSTEEIFLERSTTKVTLKNTVRFIKRTKRTSKLLSPLYFHLSLCAFYPLTFHIYQLIAFVLSQKPHHVLLYVGFIIEILGPGLVGLWIHNRQSEDLKQHFKEIKEKIRFLVTCKDSLVEINGMEHDEEYARKIVIEMLDEFQGFDANGCFTLGNSFFFTVFATAAISYGLLLLEFHFSNQLW